MTGPQLLLRKVPRIVTTSAWQLPGPRAVNMLPQAAFITPGLSRAEAAPEDPYVGLSQLMARGLIGVTLGVVA